MDDALHCEDLGDGIFEIGVHIADVSYFVEKGNALDQVSPVGIIIVSFRDNLETENIARSSRTTLPRALGLSLFLTKVTMICILLFSGGE